MWVNGANLDQWQVNECLHMGYSPDQVTNLTWYVTASGNVSRRHKPRGGLDDQDVNLILTGLAYLALSPHLPMVASGATRDDVERTIERVNSELFGDGDQSGQGRADD